MRQNNNNNNKNRMRGRGRKPGNSMNRNFESNGPDVKIRGNAGHIAEKYQNLARDALSNGDTVMAENYYQHAEHYSRIVAAAQQNTAQNNSNNRPDDSQNSNGRGPQPDIEGVPAEVALNENSNEVADASKDAGGKPEEGRSRRKPRAPRNEDDTADRKTEEVASSASSSVESEVENKPKGRTRRPRTPRKEVISDDAAGLPESLTSAPVVVEESKNLVEESSTE